MPPANAGSPHLLLALAQQCGGWFEFLNREQTALALSQLTAAHILPPLVPLLYGSDLLEYEVAFRSQLDETILNELRIVLAREWREMGWEQVGKDTYLCVIGAGVAACLNTTPNNECLSLRYSSDLQHELYLAGRTVDLPRSRLFLQTALYEKFNLVLSRVRAHLWFSISG